MSLWRPAGRRAGQARRRVPAWPQLGRAFLAARPDCHHQAPQPTLFLHGDNDGASAPESYDEADGFLSAGLVVEPIGGTGHFPHLEKPTQTNQLIIV